MVKGFCNEFAEHLVRQYLSGDVTWQDADAVANHYYGLMIQHCGKSMPAYAWDVYLAFDEGEIEGRDSFTRDRLSDIQREYGRA